MPKKINLIRTLIALAPLAIALPVAMDIYIPAVPHITYLFKITQAQMQLTLSLFMFASAIIQIAIGPITDRIGRKLSLFILILIFTAGCIVCSAAHNLAQLLLGRIIQACGSCGMMVVGLSVARDLYNGTQLARSYSFLNGITSFSPMFAPFIGSYLDIHYGWPATFEALLLISLTSLILYFSLMPETWPAEKRLRLNLKSIFSSYKMMLRDPMFTLYTAIAAVGLSYLFIFCTISPVILITLLHIPEAHYGYYFAFMGVSFFIGSFFSAYIVGKVGIFKTAIIGNAISLCGGAIMFLWYYFFGLSIGGFVLPMVLIGLGGTCCMGAGTAGAVDSYQEMSGIASAFSSSGRFLFSAITGLIISQFIHSTLPLAIPAMLFSTTAIVLMLKYKKTLVIP